MNFHFLNIAGDPVMDSFLLAALLLGTGGLLPVLLARFHVAAHMSGMLLATVGCLVGAASAVMALMANSPTTYSIPWTTAGIHLVLHVDGLAAFFLLPIFVVGCAAALYGYSYLQHDLHKPGKMAFHWFFFNGLMLSMVAVVTAGNALQFLIAWEGMSLSSFFLVCYDYENEDVCRAGWLYFIATHIGVAFLFFFFLAAATQCGSLDFSSFNTLGALSPGLTGGLFILILIGFGSKAGLFPMHVWLPDAHPAAPSHVSALMSGVMIKAAVYGFLRMLTFFPPLPQWSVILLILLGLIGAVFGIGMAVSQTDIKRSLAYSTVENINLIFLGIGLWLFGVQSGWPVMGAIALIGTLLHVWNHALFKGLMFMGAGSVLHGTGTRFFSRFGGLLRRMPFSGIMLIAGSVAIAGLPPFNGFVSELYLYMSVVLMGQSATGVTAVSALLILSAMILVGGLALFSVCRLCGMALLGEPRSSEAENAVESAPLMLLPMTILCILCLLIGVAPTLAMSAVKVGPLHILFPNLTVNFNVLPFLFSQQWTFLSIAILSLFAIILVFRARKQSSTPSSSTWGCGFQKPNRRMVYSAGGFTQLAEDTIFCDCVSPDIEMTPTSGIFRKTFSLKQTNVDPMFAHLFMPLFANLSERAISYRKLQAGKLNIYLLYIFIATLLLLGLEFFQNS